MNYIEENNCDKSMSVSASKKTIYFYNKIRQGTAITITTTYNLIAFTVKYIADYKLDTNIGILNQLYSKFQFNLRKQ